jgi:hypothetical protein
LEIIIFRFGLGSGHRTDPSAKLGSVSVDQSKLWGKGRRAMHGGPLRTAPNRTADAFRLRSGKWSHHNDLMMHFRVYLTLAALLFVVPPPLSAAGTDRPIKVAIIGLVHGHVNGWLRADRHAALELVGVYEPAVAVAQKYQQRYELDSALFFNDLDAMLETQRPEAAWVFTSTFEHERVVEVCARRGIHVIVEAAKRSARTGQRVVLPLAN